MNDSSEEHQAAPHEEKLAFRPRARLLQLLGDQLIGSARLAVFELVKNAYDADATQVTVTLNSITSPDASIVVQDNGDGMTLDIIKNIWLVPAHDHRGIQRLEKKRTRLNRLPLGEKGLGRFAVHKLGDRIELITRAKDELKCVLVIDWDSLVQKPFLSEAEVTVETRIPVTFLGETTGTRITVRKLRDTSSPWSRGEVRRLFRQITSISSPFSNRSDVFRTVLEIPQHPEWLEGVGDIKTLLGRAPWKFRFTVEDGKITWTYEFRGVSGIRVEPRKTGGEKADLKISQNRDIGSPDNDQQDKPLVSKRVIANAEQHLGIGTVEGTFYVFDRDRDVLMHMGDSQLIQNYLDEHGGLRVYRDGIRVYNYGEPGDDWLGLDLRRVNTPTRNVSRNIIIGAIDLSLEASTGLVEKTSREGFIENAAFNRLKQIVLGALSLFEIERKIDKDNIRRVMSNQTTKTYKSISEPIESLREIAKRHHILDTMAPIINAVENNFNDMRDTMLQSGLSGIGLAIVFHEIERGVRVLYDAIEAGSSLEFLTVQARDLVLILDGFADLVRKSDRKPNSVKLLFQRLRDINRVRLRSHNIQLTCPLLDQASSDTECEFSFSLLLGALNNLLDNAIYWLQVRWPDVQDKTKRKVFLNLEQDGIGNVAMVLADNGPGFQDDPDRLTRPFFSRRPEGMGLGLYYASLVMELNQGRLAFPHRDEVDVPQEFDGAVLALILNKGVAV